MLDDEFAELQRLMETNPGAVEKVLYEDPWLRNELAAADASLALLELRQELGDELFFLIREYLWVRENNSKGL